LSQNWHRDYDPSLGRYIESDPIGLAGGINTYAYATGNPLGSIDPDGLKTWQIGGGGSIYGFGYSWGLAFDDLGNFATYSNPLIGKTFGTGEAGGWFEFLYSPNAECVEQLAGPFGFVDVGVGVGLHESVVGFVGQGYHGWGGTIGVGLGSGVTIGGGNTTITPIHGFR
jgi:hypothetical protein